MADITIKTVQFKRGLEAKLIAKLKAGETPGVLKAGEPAYATDTHVLKIGDGSSDYEDLPAISGSGTDINFIITDPLDDQVLVYDSTSNSWLNKSVDQVGALRYYLEQAQQAAAIAGQKATDAGTYATNASRSADLANKALNDFKEYVETKFWWGTLSQYNELEYIEDGTFYFITAEE